VRTSLAHIIFYRIIDSVILSHYISRHYGRVMVV